ncbi:MAG: hypothetical protein B7Z15_06040 [Rhizobiales bacterium 32-66-8]|nr:MAG: hypothetical protein B7Z15_06040 [Rhizobiales bacterium 32-66-8]
MAAPALTSAATALILVDLQLDFLPGGRLAVAAGDELVPMANALARQFGTVILTQDWHPPGHISFASSHPGQEPFDTIALPYGPQVDSYSTFYEADPTIPTGLTGYLRARGIRRVVLMGLAYDFCVSWSALDAVRDGFETYVVADACRAIDTGGSQAKATAAMTEAGVTLCGVAEGIWRD